MLLLGDIRSHDVIFGLFFSSIKQVVYNGIGQYAASNCNSKDKEYILSCQVLNVWDTVSKCTWRYCGFLFCLGCPQGFRPWVERLCLMLRVGCDAPVR